MTFHSSVRFPGMGNPKTFVKEVRYELNLKYLICASWSLSFSLPESVTGGQGEAGFGLSNKARIETEFCTEYSRLDNGRSPAQVPA